MAAVLGWRMAELHAGLEALHGLARSVSACPSQPDDIAIRDLEAGALMLVDAALLAPAASGAYRLELKPRGAAASFTRVTLVLAQRDFAIEGAEVLDGAGNLMRYRFFDGRRNHGLPATTFDFEPPPGTEVLRP